MDRVDSSCTNQVTYRDPCSKDARFGKELKSGPQSPKAQHRTRHLRAPAPLLDKVIQRYHCVRYPHRNVYWSSYNGKSIFALLSSSTNVPQMGTVWLRLSIDQSSIQPFINAI